MLTGPMLLQAVSIPYHQHSLVQIVVVSLLCCYLVYVFLLDQCLAAPIDKPRTCGHNFISLLSPNIGQLETF